MTNRRRPRLGPTKVQLQDDDDPLLCHCSIAIKPPNEESESAEINLIKLASASGYLQGIHKITMHAYAQHQNPVPVTVSLRTEEDDPRDKTARAFFYLSSNS